MTFEVSQGGDKFWVYGADAQVKVTDRVQVGGSFARDENPFDHYGIYGGNAVFDLGMKTFLFGEFAHSTDQIAGDGNAEHSSCDITRRNFPRESMGRADDHLKNPNAILTEGRTEGGAQISYQFGKKTRAIIQALDSESRAGGTLRGVLAGVEQTFGKDIRLELDGRYSTESSTPANAASAETPGSTPNEVRSARLKFTLPLPWSEGKGRVYGEYEQDVVDFDKQLVAAGGDYQLDTKTRLYVRHEFISSLGDLSSSTPPSVRIPPSLESRAPMPRTRLCLMNTGHATVSPGAKRKQPLACAMHGPWPTVSAFIPLSNESLRPKVRPRLTSPLRSLARWSIPPIPTGKGRHVSSYGRAIRWTACSAQSGWPTN